MIKSLPLTFLSVLSNILPVGGYGTGAPHGACYDLAPQHYGIIPKDPKQFPNPYSIETLSGSYLFTSGREIKLRLSGHPFRGFIFQVTDDHGRSRGKFVSPPPAAATLTCRYPDDTVTHVSPDVKEEIILSWRAPQDVRHQVLYLRGTVVESENTFWSDKVVLLYNSLHSKDFETDANKQDL